MAETRANPISDEERQLQAALEQQAKGNMSHDPALNYGVPELAGAKLIASALVNGSPKASRKARFMGWLTIFTFFGIPVLLTAAAYFFN